MKYLLLLLALCLGTTIASQNFTQTGKASFYASKFEGRKTASGAIFSNQKMTAAHKELAFGTKVKVTNLANQKSVVVTINDRGPFVKGRIIDVSQKAAKELGFYKQGIAKVTVEVINNRVDQYPLQPLQPLKLDGFSIITISDIKNSSLLEYRAPL